VIEWSKIKHFMDRFVASRHLPPTTLRSWLTAHALAADG
jgi:hypothetical protein